MTTICPQPHTPPFEINSTPPVAPRQNGLHITIARTLPELRALRDHWLALRARRNLLTSENEPDHFTAVLPLIRPPAEPHVALFQRGDQPVALLIARRSIRSLTSRIGYLRLPSPPVRSLDVIHGGILTDGSRPAARLVAAHLTGLCGSTVDCITINHLPTTHHAHAALIESRADPHVLADPPQRHWVFSLLHQPGHEKTTPLDWSRALPPAGQHPTAASLDAYFQTHKSPKARKNMRRQDRVLSSHFGGDLSLVRLTRPSEVDRFVAEAAAVTRAGYQSALGAGLGDSDIQRAILHAAAARGAMRCYLLRAQGQTLAFQCGIMVGARYHLQATAYLPAFAGFSPGQVLLVRVLRDLADDGLTGIDYGLGDAHYKRVFGTCCWEEQTLRLVANTPRGLAARWIVRSTSAVDRVARTLASRTGSAGPIKKWWRSTLRRRSRAALDHRAGFNA